MIWVTLLVVGVISAMREQYRALQPVVPESRFMAEIAGASEKLSE